MKGYEDQPLPKRILQAAFVTFVERGYDKASMDEVAAVAGTTKRTVYAHFDNKETLFRAAIGNAVERFLSELPDLDPAGDPEAELAKFASLFSDLCTWRRAVLLQRVVIGEAERYADLGEMLHREVIGGAERRIARFLTARFAIRPPPDGGSAEERALALARLFLNMATGPQRTATLMEARKPPQDHPFWGGTRGGDTPWVSFAVRFFLDGLAASAAPRPAPDPAAEREPSPTP
ncbi:TetR/AcrR family transcriptional regulator [Methylobrevis albus]|uniref:TetR/AcrR family transcriptional regulator n=1 Tax=Methylobrevis albus TaxID=2793297 RepID=A0A931I3C0_9HYPH|nr:TetR/AcrR family transcriptional regulator [Methylobrevis albus]MBH0239082.1 TetR/AcrR family transcriptional regulator [Methylobrevis albus]